MNEDKIHKLNNRMLDGYSFKFENYISRGFEICTRFAFGFVAFFTLTMLISYSLNLIPPIGSTIYSVFLNPIFSAGFFIVASSISLQKDYSFHQFWEGFKDFQQLAIAGLIQYVIYLLIISPFLFSEEYELIIEWLLAWQQDPFGVESFPSIPSYFFLLLIPLIYLTVSWIFAPMFIVFYKMRAWDALETSRKLITQKWLIFALFTLVVGIIAVSGILLFGLGILFTIPVSSCIFYAAFEDITRFYEEDSEEEDPMKHLIDAF